MNNNNVYINICSSDDYNIMDEEADNKNTNLNLDNQAWATWEELLLACAVKRHGFADWDSVATEVQSRSSISGFLTSANICKQKYRDLKRRFHKSDGGESDAAAAAEKENGEEERISNISWLEELRKLRVAELRREVQQYDDSILSLQMKVKKLVEERGGDHKPDLVEDRSEHRKEVVSTAEEESDRENRSMNESNSTDSGDKTNGKDEPSQTRDDSCDDNNPDLDPVYTTEEGSEASQSGKTETSGSKWKRKRREYTDGDKDNNDGEIGSEASESQPLIGLLDLIRSHPRGSLFERRLQSQETKDYKSLVKQHLDIETIHRKLKQGSYDSSSITFYRDLQLLFTNAIVFFPSSSSEFMAAHELRTVVSEEAMKQTRESGPRLVSQEEALAMTGIKADAETSESSLARRKSSLVPLIVCKRRSSFSAKASPSSSSLSHKEEALSEEKENIATGVRSSRRGNKVVDYAMVIANNTKAGRGKSKQKQTEPKLNDDANDNSKQETGKTEKKMVSSDKKKSVADFLKRLKNSPQKEGKDQSKSSENGKKEGKKKAEVEKTPVKKSPGRPQKKAAAAATASKKRGRESTGKDNKQPKKRNRK
ncbi:unnamed protein product [Cochlearia groenlandica]